MNEKNLNILILEDSPNDAELMIRELEKEGFVLEWKRVDTEKAFKKALSEKPDIILADYKLPSYNGLAAIKLQQKIAPEIPLILVSGTIGEERAVECLKAGATDYILKDKLSRLSPVVKSALKEAEEHRERKKAKETLKKSEEQFRLISENTSDVITLHTFDLKASYTYISPSVKALAGYEPEDLLGKSCFDIIHPENKKVLFPLLKKYIGYKLKNLITGKESAFNETIELRIKNKSGKWIYVQSTVNIIGDQLLIVTRDITERKQSEEKIKHLNQILHAIRYVNQLITKEKDRNRLIKRACKKLIETRGYFNAWIILLDDSGKYLTSAESGLGKDFLYIIELIKNDKITACGKNALKKSDVFITENPPDECKDCPLSGKYANRGTMTIRLEYEGKIYGLASVSIPKELIKDEEEHNLFKEVAGDIAFALHSIEVEKKRKWAEQIQKVLYNISNAVSITDNLEKLISLVQEELGTIIDITNFYIALYDYKTDTFSLPFFADEKDKFTSIPAGKTLTKYVIETKKPLLANIDVKKRLVKEGKLEYKGSLSKIWLGIPLKVEGEITGVLSVQSYTDENAYNEADMEMLEFVSVQISISIKQKKAEQDLINALKKATESDRLKTAFLNTISHELRTPLNAVIGFSGIIDNDTPIDEILDYSKTINDCGNHLLEIIEDVFDISMIESGEVEIQKQEFNITTFMDDIHKKLKAEQELTDKQHIDIYFNPVEKAKDFFVYTDQSKLKRILINILKNALKFTHEGNIEYGYIKETQQEEPMLKFYIKDTGIGIPENKLDIIFEIFRQADDTDTRLYGGTGIGLSVSKKLVDLLGGKIWVDTEEENLPAGKAGGSTFYFTLPYLKPETFKK